MKLRPGAAGLVALGMAAALLMSPSGSAHADNPTEPPRLLTAHDAMALAAQTGQPVIASALTDERTLITADPRTGLMHAELTAGVVRVPDGVGGWRKPSTRLVPGADGWLRPEAALADFSVSPGGNGELVSVRSRDGAVLWAWPDVLPAPTVVDDTATYAEVLPGADLVVRAGIEQVESFLVVKTRAAAANPRVRQFSLNTAYQGLSPVQLSNGAVELRTPDGQAQVLIPPARMWDSRGAEKGISSAAAVEEAPLAASAGVELVASRSDLAVAANTGLLDDLDTVFPVIIDPAAQPLVRSYVVRVTEDFVTINDMSVDGKIGYNGGPRPTTSPGCSSSFAGRPMQAARRLR